MREAMKLITLLYRDSSGEQAWFKISISPGSKVRQVVDLAGLPNPETYVLADEFGDLYVPEEDFFAAAEDGTTYVVVRASAAFTCNVIGCAAVR